MLSQHQTKTFIYFIYVQHNWFLTHSLHVFNQYMRLLCGIKERVENPFFHHCYGSYSPPVTSYILLEDYFFLHVLLGSKLRLRSHLYGDRLSQVEGSPTYPLVTQRVCKESQFYSVPLRHILYVVLAILQSAECFFHACTLLLHN